jgi:hypothetical protein
VYLCTEHAVVRHLGRCPTFGLLQRRLASSFRQGNILIRHPSPTCILRPVPAAYVLATCIVRRIAPISFATRGTNRPTTAIHFFGHSLDGRAGTYWKGAKEIVYARRLLGVELIGWHGSLLPRTQVKEIGRPTLLCTQEAKAGVRLGCDSVGCVGTTYKAEVDREDKLFLLRAFHLLLSPAAATAFGQQYGR